MQTALVTGGNKGIGFEIARQLGQQNFKVFLTARNITRGEAAVKSLGDLGIQAHFVQMDVSNPKSIQTAFDQVSSQVSHLDVLINNAGILLDEHTPLLDLPPDQSLLTLQTNALGALWVVQTFSPILSKGSRIIMMSSGAGTFCPDISSWAPMYSISKTTMNAITRQLHLALKNQGIIINAMCPGWVKTDMGGSGASRTVEKGAETAVWLAREAPASINGQFLRDKNQVSW